MARLRAVADTGPLLAAASARDRAHRLAAAIVHEIGRGLVLPLPVIAEVDYMIRTRVGSHSARRLLAAIAASSFEVAYLTPRLLRRAVEIDDQHADLDLGLTDTSVMAVAERHELPILTFDFADFRAAPSPAGPWQLVVNEAQLASAVGGG